MEVIAHMENPFPNSLDGKLDALLSVVNMEFKTLTMLHLDDIPAEGSEIKARIRETVGRDIYLPQSGTFADYNSHSLFPIGTVAEEEVMFHRNGKIVQKYKLTGAGRTYGRPIAAFTLDYVFKNNESMYNILGSTISSGSSRSPSNRVKILEALRNQNLKEGDIREISGGFSVLGNLNILHGKEMINYDSCGEMAENRDKFIYIWTEKDLSELQTINHYRNWTKEVSLKLRELGEVSLNQMCNHLNFKTKSKTAISSVLSGLVNQGFAKRKRWKAGSCSSEARLLDDGRKFLENYVDKVRDALNDGPNLEEMNIIYTRLMNCPHIFCEQSRRAIDLYRAISPMINKRSLGENQERIMRYLASNPGKRYSEIRDELSLRSLAKYITPLVKSGTLKKVKERKGCARYYLED